MIFLNSVTPKIIARTPLAKTFSCCCPIVTSAGRTPADIAIFLKQTPLGGRWLFVTETLTYLHFMSISDVYPYLRSLCRRLGVDFGTVDMRWGVTQEATLDHSTVDMCVNEIHRYVYFPRLSCQSNPYIRL